VPKITGTKIGVVCKDGINTAAQAGDMAREAMLSGNIDRADLVFAFCTYKTDPFEFVNGIREVAGSNVPIIGGSAIGLISNNFLSYTEFTSGIAIIQSDRLACRTAAVNDVDKDENDAGKRLAKEMVQRDDDKVLIIFYDSIKTPPGVDSPPMMNSSSYLLGGINSEHPFDVPVLGAGLVGDFSFNPTVQFCGSSIRGQRAVGAMLSGAIDAHYSITHGCTPLDGIYHTITKIDGPVLYELDGLPVVEFINEMFGSDEWQKEHPVAYLTIGINRGDKYGRYEEEKYVNRLITGVTADQKGIVMFEPDLKAGMEIQFMSRDAEQMVQSARKNSASLLKSIEDKRRKPVFGLYIDCAGRAGQYSHTDVEEASEIQKVMNQYNVPFIGFYSGVELAPFQGTSRGLDWTGVLLVLSED
jgi:hypothetical protein